MISQNPNRSLKKNFLTSIFYTKLVARVHRAVLNDIGKPNLIFPCNHQTPKLNYFKT